MQYLQRDESQSKAIEVEPINLDVRRDVIYSDAFKEFRLRENIGEREISTGLPLDPNQEVMRLWVASRRYEIQGYLEGIDTVEVTASPIDVVTKDEAFLTGILSPEQYAKFREKGIVLKFKDDVTLYIDPYHFHSIPIYGVMGGIPQGSVRIILPSNEYGLPTFRDSSIAINAEYEDLVSQSQAELSQFAIAKGAHPGMSSALLRSAVAVSKAVGIDKWIGTTDNFVLKHLNGAYFKFDLPNVGPEVYYLGSNSTPVFIDIDKSLDNAESHDSSRPVANFIRGGEISKDFEWYKGK